MNEKIYYIESNDFSENWLNIKEGFLIKVFETENGFKMATIRENVDKYRPEHFHDVPFCNVKIFKENSEIDFLNYVINTIHDRLVDIWNNLKYIPKTK